MEIKTRPSEGHHMHFPSLIFTLLLPLIAISCSTSGSSVSSQYVTRAELQSLLALPPGTDPMGDGLGQPLTASELEALTRRAVAADDNVNDEARIAAATVVADQRVRPLARTLQSIDDAIRIC